MDLDVLERARSGDRDAFRALIAAWGDRVLRTAVLLCGDRARAEQAVAAAFLGTWVELPASHSERPFRPWLMRAVRDAVRDLDPQHRPDEEPQQDPLRRCLDSLGEQGRTTAVLHLYDEMGATELALVDGINLGAAAKRLRDALRALHACASEAGLPAGEDAIRGLLGEAVRGTALAPWFNEDAIEPALSEPETHDIRRLVAADPAGAWARMLEPATVPAWVQADDVRVRGVARLEPGARIVAKGRIAGRRASRDETLVTRAGDDRVLAWTTRARVRPWTSAIEFRWTLEVVPASGGCELVHRLRGVAFPQGLPGRFLRAAYARAADGMPGSMHAGLERLAQLLEAGARRAPLS